LEKEEENVEEKLPGVFGQNKMFWKVNIFISFKNNFNRLADQNMGFSISNATCAVTET
jgi:hypothetical protein